MKTRKIHLNPGEEKFITAEEVRDEELRSKLQVRAISIVRPSTESEEEELLRELGRLAPQEGENNGEEEPEGAEESSDNVPT